MPGGWCWTTEVIDALLALKAITDPDTLAGHRRLFVSAALIGASAEAGPPGAVGRRHHALARRLRRRLDDYLRFAVDPRVPFDNNPAALRQQPGRARHPDGEDQAEGCPGACARWPALRTSPRCAPTCPPRPSTAAGPSTSSPN